MKLKQTSYVGNLIALIIVAGISLAAIIGWVLNFVKLFTHSWDITGEFILRIVGVVIAPIGAILGYL
jgi:type III secretory pathway component EscS